MLWCDYLSEPQFHRNYREVSNIRGTWVGNENVDHLDVVGASPVGASPVGAAPTTSSFSTEHFDSIYCAKTTTTECRNI